MIFNCDAKPFQKRNQQAGGSWDCRVFRTAGLTLRCHSGLLAQISTWPVCPQRRKPVQGWRCWSMLPQSSSTTPSSHGPACGLRGSET